jgi:hypothetical protein
MQIRVPDATAQVTVSVPFRNQTNPSIELQAAQNHALMASISFVDDKRRSKAILRWLGLHMQLLRVRGTQP